LVLLLQGLTGSVVHGVYCGCDLFLGRHVEDLKQVVDVEMIEVQRFQNDLADHEVNILLFQLNLFEKLIKVFFGDSALAVPLFSESLQDMLLILSH
jgi:hypothetical protein